MNFHVSLTFTILVWLLRLFFPKTRYESIYLLPSKGHRKSLNADRRVIRCRNIPLREDFACVKGSLNGRSSFAPYQVHALGGQRTDPIHKTRVAVLFSMNLYESERRARCCHVVRRECNCMMTVASAASAARWLHTS